MTQRLDTTVATVTADNLFYANTPAATTDGVVIASGEGKLKRGCVLAKNADGKFVALGTLSEVPAGAEEGTVGTKFEADCILCDDVDATEADVNAVAYRTGHFDVGSLSTKSGYTFADEDKDALRTKGILVSRALK